ncbi:hypothetical protein ACGE24_08235 [Corynebacterium kroppenstedtii]|uniref:hypothetical protein n=1 Tax=Corynebacterium sp. PCR 32 TaxID=3351342 RepID=UPI00309A2BA4
MKGTFLPSLRRAQFLVLFGVLTSMLIIALAISDVGSWGESAYLVLADLLTRAPHILIPWCAGVGVMVGQARWRAGLAPWDTVSASTRRRTLLLSVKSSVGAVLAAVFGTTVLLLAYAISGALYDGVSLGVIGGEIVSGLWYGILSSFIIVSIFTAIGAWLGWKFKAMWMTPLVVIVTFVCAIAGMATEILPFPNDRTAGMNTSDLVCKGTGPRICAVSGNSPYLDTALVTAKDYYDRSPVAAALPHTILLVDNSAGLDFKRSPYYAVVDIATNRGFTAPPGLNPDRFTQQLESSIANHCHDFFSSENDEIMGLLHDGGPDAAQKLQSLNNCGGQ